MKREDLTAEILHQVLRYDPETGKLFWKERPLSLFQDTPLKTAAQTYACWNGRRAGKEAITALDSHGYKQGWVLGVKVKAHTVIFIMMTGRTPNDEVDHVDGTRSDNRWDNLREVTRSKNNMNRAAQRNNRSGVAGVLLTKQGKWLARITLRRRTKHIGEFSTFEQAVTARKEWEAKLGFSHRHGLNAAKVVQLRSGK